MMGRLIDADDVIEMLTNVDISGGNVFEAKQCLRDILTAYDVENVVEQLEELRSELLYSTDYESQIINYCLDWMDKAIEIVKGGK